MPSSRSRSRRVVRRARVAWISSELISRSVLREHQVRTASLCANFRAIRGREGRLRGGASKLSTNVARSPTPRRVGVPSDWERMQALAVAIFRTGRAEELFAPGDLLALAFTFEGLPVLPASRAVEVLRELGLPVPPGDRDRLTAKLTEAGRTDPRFLQYNETGFADRRVNQPPRTCGAVVAAAATIFEKAGRRTPPDPRAAAETRAGNPRRDPPGDPRKRHRHPKREPTQGGASRGGCTVPPPPAQALRRRGRSSPTPGPGAPPRRAGPRRGSGRACVTCSAAHRRRGRGAESEESSSFASLTGVEPHRYQLETVRRVLRVLRGRALLADEVGLGKTIEALIVLREYQLRGMVRRALILVPPALVEAVGPARSRRRRASPRAARRTPISATTRRPSGARPAWPSRRSRRPACRVMRRWSRRRRGTSSSSTRRTT